MLKAVFAELSVPAMQAVPTGPSSWLVVCGSALAILACTGWALLERFERRSIQRRSDTLSTAFQSIIEQHYRERLQAEERHLMAHDSTVRNILESLERSLLGKPRL